MTRPRPERHAPLSPGAPFVAPDALSGYCAVVTGGTRGIGRAIALALATAGARVTATYAHSEADAEAVRIALGERGQGHQVRRSDAGDPGSVAGLFDELRTGGSIDILVNNAAVTPDGLLMMLSDAAWNDVLATDLGGPFLCTRAALRTMIARRFGRITNVISPAGLMGKAGAANYAAAKGGLLGMTKSLAAEVAPLGITVNAVCPGIVETDLLSRTAPETRAAMIARIPAGRPALPEEIAHAVVFLALPHAGYITGTVLTVDGGLLTG